MVGRANCLPTIFIQFRRNIRSNEEEKMTVIGNPSLTHRSDVNTILKGATETINIDDGASTEMKINCVDATKFIIAIVSFNSVSGGALGAVAIRYLWTDRDGNERTIDESLGTGDGIYTTDVPCSEEAVIRATEVTDGAGDTIDVAVVIKAIRAN